MLALWLVAALIALLGHGILWIGLVNKLHATGMPRWLVKSTTFWLYLALVSTPLAVASWASHHWTESAATWRVGAVWSVLAVYGGFCLLLAAIHVPRWSYARWTRSRRTGLTAVETTAHDICQRLAERPVAGLMTNFWTRVPGNQLLKIEVCQKELVVPRLPPRLEGLSVAHLSDLHLHGHVTQAYFEEVVGLVNEMQADLAVVTGDVCDSSRAIDWIAETLGHVQSRYGKFYVLGNHDLRIRQIDVLRDALVAAGFIDLGGRWHQLDVQGEQILLAGNELPWWGPAADMASAPSVNRESHALRVLLAHTPDQFQWAQACDFDLMLAGHTHGGQICLPLVGPVVCPSRFGVKYASGTHYEPPTVLHVSRGISSMSPMRFNCPMEVAKLVLTAGHA